MVCRARADAVGALDLLEERRDLAKVPHVELVRLGRAAVGLDQGRGLLGADSSRSVTMTCAPSWANLREPARHTRATCSYQCHPIAKPHVPLLRIVVRSCILLLGRQTFPTESVMIIVMDFQAALWKWRLRLRLLIIGTDDDVARPSTGSSAGRRRRGREPRALSAEVWASASERGALADRPRSAPLRPLDCRPARSAGGSCTTPPERRSICTATDSIDCDTVLGGHVELGLEAGSVLLEPGDLVLIPGLAHRWLAGDEGSTLQRRAGRPRALAARGPNRIGDRLGEVPREVAQEVVGQHAPGEAPCAPDPLELVVVVRDEDHLEGKSASAWCTTTELVAWRGRRRDPSATTRLVVMWRVRGVPSYSGVHGD